MSPLVTAPGMQRWRGPLRFSTPGACALALGVAALFSTCVHAQDSCADLQPQVRQLLHAMSSNAQRVDYSGVVTLQRGGDMQIMEISHAITDGRATEQISRLTGQDAQVLRDAHPVSCTHPGQQLLLAQHADQGAVCALGKVYGFRVSAGERVAGREAVRLRVEPRDMYRFGYVFELDRDTALMLKSTTLGEDQRVLEQFQFASLKMDAQPVDAAGVAHRAAHPHPQESSAPASGPAWRVAWLPEGFTATDAAHATAARKSYTDGLAAFSVFLEPLNVAIKPGEGVEREGSTVAYTRGVVLQQRPVLVTVLGEIPTNTARMVADSVRLH